MKIKNLLMGVSCMVKKALAFSLIELMISLITISCITAAFAPVITKRLSSKSVSLGVGSTLSTNCTSDSVIDKEHCLMCLKNKCIVCTLSCANNQYKNTETCNCLNCSDNFGRTDEGSVHDHCTKCDETRCTSCKAGYYLNPDAEAQKGHNACIKCPAGKFSIEGSSVCQNCSDGTWSTEGSSSCDIVCSSGNFCSNGVQDICPVGYKCPGGVKTACLEGQYQNQQGQSDCKNCDPGKYQNERGKSSCNNCPQGQYQPNSGQTSCHLCPPGTYQQNVGKSTCTNCTAGTWSNDWGRTTDCPASSCPSGFVCANGSSNQCAANTVPNSAQTECVSCGDGKWSLAGATTCNGCSVANCKTCPNNSCSQCNDGLSMINGACTTCSSAFANCNSCTASACIGCNGGYYVNGTGCSTCPTGCSACSSNTVCTSCTNGYYKNGNSCTICPQGSYCTGGTKYSCTGTQDYTSSTGATSCSQCPSGQKANSTHTGCEASWNCSGDDFFQAELSNGTKICVTKKNMGDSTNLTIPSGVLVKDVGMACTTGNCCWKGATTTSSYCDNASGYSGCNRTVCTWTAANAICAGFTAGGGGWRLPNMGDYSTNYSDLNSCTAGHLASNGKDELRELMFYYTTQLDGCMNMDYGTDSAGLSKCGTAGRYTSSEKKCIGAYNNYCIPSEIWLKDQKSDYTPTSYHYCPTLHTNRSGGIGCCTYGNFDCMAVPWYQPNWALSVRCVKTM